MDDKSGGEDTTPLVTIGEGRIKRLKITQSRQAIAAKTTMLRLDHTHGKDLVTLNNINAINTLSSTSRPIFQTRPAAGTSHHRRCICRKASMPCCMFALLSP